MKKLILIVLLFAVVIWWYNRTPPAEEIVVNMQLRNDNSEIVLHQTIYHTGWDSAPVTHAGDVRNFVRANHATMPLITHEAIVTTGEFSDPEIVTISPIRDGNMYWRSKKRPQGTLIVLHFIPKDIGVLHDLQQVDEGKRYRFIGYKESDSSISGSDDSFMKLIHRNHQLILLTAIETF